MALLRIAFGAVVWAAHFAAIYGATGLACARGSGAGALLAVGAATLVGALAAVTIVALTGRYS